MQLGAGCARVFFGLQGFGNDAYYASARIGCGLGYQPHQAVVATAVYQLTVVLANPRAYLACDIGVFGLDAIA
jgi:hypothetical protein